MSEAADLIVTNAAVHTLTGPDRTVSAVAIRDGRIQRVGSATEVGFLEGVETNVIDLDGCVVLPGFVDAHTHMHVVGHHEVDADLSGVGGPEVCLDKLRAASAVRSEWILGFGYDESTWDQRRYLTRADLDRVSETRPVAAFREDMHTVSVNSVVLERYREKLPDACVQMTDGEPTGVIVEDATAVIWDAIDPGPDEMRELLLAAQERAHANGVTAVHEMVSRQATPRVYRALDLMDALALRVRLNYWVDYLDTVLDAGLRTNHGSEYVRMGAIKIVSDGSIGARTARLSTPYEDGDENGGETGQWVHTPAELAAFANRVDNERLQAAVHAIGDEAITATLEAFEGTDPANRHRIEHAEVLTDSLIERLGASALTVCAQPNFLKWARDGGLYAARLGTERAHQTNRYRDLLAAGGTLAFGSDCMPLDPLFGIQQAVTAPAPGQRLSVTDALRAYTLGGARAGFDEDRLGTIECGKYADLVVLTDSPWDVPDEQISNIDVAMTIVSGDVVYKI